MKKFLLLGGLLTLLGAGCATQTPTDAKPPVPVVVPPEAAAIQNMIRVKDQKPGDEAMMDLVSIERKGYVVVHEEDSGKIGKIVGTSVLLNAGETTSIKMMMKIHAGLMHAAMLHVDNGDGVFDEKQDLPLKDENGEFVMQSFKGMGEAMKTETKMME